MTSSWQSRKRCSIFYDGSFPLHFLRRDEAVPLHTIIDPWSLPPAERIREVAA